MAVNFNVVLLFGPPFSGKSQHCQKRYVHAGFERICPAERFLTNQDLGLRDISILITKLLEKGKKIVIDDENSSLKTRKSYISFIRRKFPKCKFQLVKLCPLYGYLQCMWTREFVLASECDLHGVYKDHYITKWFTQDALHSSTFSGVNVDEPHADEELSIDEKKSCLTAITHFKFEVTALFLQWEGISSQNDLHLVDKLARICNEWEAVNPCGRVFIICDARNVSKGLLTALNEETSVRTFTTQLVSQVSMPVYVFELHQATEAGRFCIPPQPGILAFLQKQHRLHINCETTLYLYASSNHKNMAENAGVRHIKFGRVLQHPKLVVTRHATETPTIPPMLQKLVLESEGDNMIAEIPLYNVIAEFKNNFVQQELPWGRREFLFAKDLDVIERFQAMYSANATPVSEPCSRIEQLRSVTGRKTTLQTTNTTFQSSTLQDGQTSVTSTNLGTASSRELPKWMLGKTKSGSVSSLEKIDSVSSTVGKSRKRITVYLMTEKELVESAKEFLKQAGREDILEKIENDKKNKESGTPKKKPVNDLGIRATTLVLEDANNQNGKRLVEITKQNIAKEVQKLKMATETFIKESSSEVPVKRTNKDCVTNMATPVFIDLSEVENERKMDVIVRPETHSNVRSHVTPSNMEDIAAMLDSVFDDKVQPQRKENVDKKRLDFCDEDDDT